jgi:multicomponent Na+:H+ antiporter subunit F
MSIQFALYIAVPLLSLAILLALLRLLFGPSAPDRVIALDLIATFGIGVVTIEALAFDEPVFIDVALILALVAFLGTVAFAYYLEKGVK